MNEIIKSSNSKPEVIARATDEITNCIEKNDLNMGRQIKDYLLSNVEDSIYAVFDSASYPLILYYIRDYNGLIEYFLNFDSIVAVNSKKIKPDNDMLCLDLTWFLPEAFKHLIIPIKQSDLCKEYKMVLILYLYKTAIYVDAVDYNWKKIDKMIDLFRDKYPNSALLDFFENHLMKDFILYWCTTKDCQ